jgi:phosphate:Na+ symporter
MKDFHIAVAALTSIILFVFGLENFSKEVQRITGERFRKFLGSVTQHPGVGVLIGAVITAIIQSSSATSVIAISLVNAGFLSFKNSVGILFGANIGTTVTAQLVAFKLTSFSPALIILGFILTFMRNRFSTFGKSLFYFGFVFFTLNLISSTMAPLQNDERLVSFLTQAQSPFVGVLIGAIISAIVQSSSVTTGLAIIFTQQGILSLENAIPILMGSNIGTTVTAVISIINMDTSAKKTALAHFFFNFGGVVIFLPLLIITDGKLPFLSKDPAIALANFHLMFNIGTAVVFMLALKPFTALIDKILGEGQMDFERFDLSSLKETSDFETAEKLLIDDLKKAFSFVQENFNLITLSIETNYKGISETAQKRIEYLDYFKTELLGFFSNYVSKVTDELETKRLVRVMSMYEYIFQLHDSVKDIAHVRETMEQNYIELKSDILLIVRELSGNTLSFFDHLAHKESSSLEKQQLLEEANELQRDLDNFNRSILKIMAKPERRDAGVVLQLVTYCQRLKDKLVNYHNLVVSNYQKPIEQIKTDANEL